MPQMRPPPLPNKGEPEPSAATVVLTLTASGSVGDYSDTSSLRQKVADAAGLDEWFVTIRVIAASVRITASIAVPAPTTASAVQSSLLSTLGVTAESASAVLGVIVESLPTVAIALPPSAPPSGDEVTACNTMFCV